MKAKIREILERTINELSALSSVPEIAAVVDNMRETLVALDLPFTILVIGEAKTGKSTFVNALLKREISPDDINEKTGNIIRFCYGKQERICGVFFDEVIQINDSEYNRAASGVGEYKDLLYIDRYIDSIFLKNLILIDSPGLNSIRTAAEDKSILQLGQCDLILFVFRATQLGKLTELRVIEEARALGRRLVAVINKEDLSENIEKQREECQRKFGNFFDEIYAVTSVPVEAPKNMEGIVSYIEAAKLDVILKIKSIVRRNYACLREINDLILERMESLKNSVSYDLEELLNMGIDDEAALTASSAKSYKKKAMVSDQIDCVMDRLTIKLINHVNKFIDERLTSLASIKAMIAGGNLGEIHIIPQDFDGGWEMPEESSGNYGMREQITGLLGKAVRRANAVITDNIKELLTETVKEVVLVLIPNSKIGSLKYVLPFTHRVNISPIEEKKLFLKRVMRESITREMKKNAVKIKLESLNNLEERKDEDVGSVDCSAGLNLYCDMLRKVQRLTNEFQELRGDLL